MQHTVKAIFDHQSDAQHALDELQASGYPRADMTLSSEPRADDTDLKAAIGEHATHLLTSLRHTATRLLGQRTDQHPDEPVHERYIVTLTVNSDPDTERAVAIIERFGPVGIEDLHAELDQGGVGAGMSGAGVGVGGMRPAYPPGTEPGVLLSRIHEDSPYFGTQNSNSPPIGNTFAEAMGTTTQWINPEEETTYIHTPHLPADSDIGSQHAADMAEDGNHGDLHSDDAESNVKSDWEHAGRGPAAWNKVKEAVRHGWDRMRS